MTEDEVHFQAFKFLTKHFFKTARTYCTKEQYFIKNTLFKIALTQFKNDSKSKKEYFLLEKLTIHCL